MKTTAKITMVFLVSLALCAAAHADELLVPAEYPTIQAAIDVAVNGDVVIVADGTYTGPGNRDIDFLGKAITVRSESGPENCIIDCNYTGRGFNFDDGEDANSVLDGFTITNGYELCGGGIYCYHSSPTINNCIITGNHAGAYTGEGGGILCVMSSPVITNCTINRNSANKLGGGITCYKGNPTIKNSSIHDNSTGGAVSAISCLYGSLTITNCTIAENEGRGIEVHRGNLAADNCTISSNSGIGPGGGIYCSGSSVITNCSINGNIAGWGGGINGWGGGIYVSGSAVIINCIINGNSANGEYAYGGGVLCSGDEDGNDTFTFSNCTITGNSATWGGGICCGYSSTTIANCILWANEAPDGPQIYLAEDSNALVSYTDVQGGQDDVYLGSGCTLNWSPGNIDLDPCFVEPGFWDANDTPDDVNDDFWVNGDYYLLPYSPCIDAGDPNYVPEPNETDIDGNPRIIGDAIDMGAYETNYIQAAAMKLTPQALSCKSKGNFVKAHFILPEGFLPEDVDVNEPAWAEPMGAESEYIEVLGNDDGLVNLEVVFDREAFCDLLTDMNDGSLEVTVIGPLTAGRYFYATDTIKIKPQHQRIIYRYKKNQHNL